MLRMYYFHDTYEKQNALIWVPFAAFLFKAAGRPQGIFEKIPRTPKTFGQMLSHLRGGVWAASRSFVGRDTLEKLAKVYFIDLLQCNQIRYFNIALS